MNCANDSGPIVIDASTEAPADRSRLRTAAPWLSLALSVAGMAVFLRVTTGEYYLGDLRVFVAAPQWLAEGSLYRATSPTGAGDVWIPFLYPPWVAAVFTPWSWLPFPVTAVLWTVLGLTALGVSVLLTLSLVTGQRQLRDRTLLRSAAWWSAGLLWITPVRHCPYEGQVSLLLLVAVVAGVWCARPASAVAIGLATATKFAPGAALVTLAVQRRPRALLWGLAGFVIPLALGAAVYPAQSRQYLADGAILDAVDRVGGVATVANQSLRAAMSRFAGADVGWQASWLLAAAFLTICATAVLIRRRGDRAVALWAPTVLAAALIPLGWTHQWVRVIPMLVWLRRGPDRRSGWARTLSLLWSPAC